MKVLSYEELNEINGGAKLRLLYFLGGAIAFVIGIINGFNHSKCQKEGK